MLEKVKLALRISHSLLDSEIEETINTASAELHRAGVSYNKSKDYDDELISMAVKTYCQYVFCSDANKAEQYNKSWLYQADNLRKTEGYADV